MDKPGAYSSPYNYIYHYLLDNYETYQQIPKDVLQKEYKAFCLTQGHHYDDKKAAEDIDKAIYNFKENNGSHGDTANNLGKTYNNSIDTIRDSLKDLRW